MCINDLCPNERVTFFRSEVIFLHFFVPFSPELAKKRKVHKFKLNLFEIHIEMASFNVRHGVHFPFEINECRAFNAEIFVERVIMWC